MGWAKLYALEENDLHNDGEGSGHGKDHLGRGGKEWQKIQIGKIIKLKKKKKKGFDKFEWRFCVDNLNWKTTILHKDWQKELWKPKVVHAQTVQENEQGVSVQTNSIEKKDKTV